MLFAGALLIVYLLSLKNKEQRIITEREAKAILVKELAWKQLHTRELLPGVTIVTGLCTLQYYDKKPLFYELGFKIRTADHLERQYSARINCYTGYLEGIEERPSGFTGAERPPIKVMMSMEDMLRQRYFSKRKLQ